MSTKINKLLVAVLALAIFLSFLCIPAFAETKSYSYPVNEPENWLSIVTSDDKYVFSFSSNSSEVTWGISYNYETGILQVFADNVPSGGEVYVYRLVRIDSTLGDPYWTLQSPADDVSHVWYFNCPGSGDSMGYHFSISGAYSVTTSPSAVQAHEVFWTGYVNEDSIISSISSGFSTITSLVRQFFTSFTTNISAFSQSVVTQFNNLKSWLSSGFTSVVDKLTDVYNAIVGSPGDSILPDGSGTVDDYDDLEQDIIGDVSGSGESAAGAVIAGATSGILSFVSGFALVSSVISKFAGISFIQAMLNIALTFGIFGAVVNLVPAVASSIGRRSSSKSGKG